MNVCLLREPSSPDPYEQALSAAGFHVTFLPVLQFRFIDPEALDNVLGQSEKYGGLIVTSPRAMEALEAVMNPHLLEAWQPKPLYVVGPRTAEAARQLGLVPLGEQGTAEALAQFIIQNPVDKPFLFLAGNRRRDVLPQILEQAGIPLEEHCVYETILRDDLKATDFSGINWLVFFSPSGVEVVQQIKHLDWDKIRLAAIGTTTQEALEAAGYPVEVVAEAPTPEHLVGAMT